MSSASPLFFNHIQAFDPRNDNGLAKENSACQIWKPLEVSSYQTSRQIHRLRIQKAKLSLAVYPSTMSIRSTVLFGMVETPW